MIDVVDRVPGDPNRKKITFEDSGEVVYATVEYADNPITVGTPINRALFQSIATDYVRAPGYVTTSGTDTAYTVTLSPAPAAYVDGMRITIVAHETNGASATLNVNNLGAIPLKNKFNAALQRKLLKANMPYEFIYQNGNFILLDEGGGSTSLEPNDVTFYDYDGTVVDSYSKSEFMQLTEMPPNPGHDGLIAQGWNWSLSDAKSFVNNKYKLDIGQLYITDDDKTRIYIHLTEGRTSPMLGLCPNGTVVVDWGDGTSTETLTGTSYTTVKWTSTHNYASAGDYVISLEVTSGAAAIYGANAELEGSYLLRYASSADTRNFAYLNSIYRIEMGLNMRIGRGAFRRCSSLQAITMRDWSSASANTDREFYAYAFMDCSSLTGLVIPANTYFGNDTQPGTSASNTSTFRNCQALKSIVFPATYSLNNQTYGAGTFNNCTSLSSIILPSSYITSNMLGSCGGLVSVIVGNVTSINGSVFSGDYNTKIGEIHFTTTTPPSITSSSFSIPTDCKIYVPSGYLSAYTSATNYPSSSTYTYVEE